MNSTWIRVDDASRLGEVRRIAVAAAIEEGFFEADTGQIAIVATEAAANLMKHAAGGEVQISRLSAQNTPGVEILAIDHGPGMGNLEECLRDGFSTAGSPGTGLGAIGRIAHEFDVYSTTDRGTVLVARICKAPRAAAPAVGSVVSPMRGEEVCGDSWSFRRNEASRTVSLLVADGLGHGVLAADASRMAAEVFQRSTDETPLQMVETVHRALKGTRGAAVAIASVDFKRRNVSYAGVGNIAGVIVGTERLHHMVSHSGTAGHQASRIQQFEYPLPATGVMVMHSDGLPNSWKLEAYPGLLRKHPSLIAGVLYRDASRRRDDIGVVVLSIEGA